MEPEELSYEDVKLEERRLKRKKIEQEKRLKNSYERKWKSIHKKEDRTEEEYYEMWAALEELVPVSIKHKNLKPKDTGFRRWDKRKNPHKKERQNSKKELKQWY